MTSPPEALDVQDVTQSGAARVARDDQRIGIRGLGFGITQSVAGTPVAADIGRSIGAGGVPVRSARIAIQTIGKAVDAQSVWIEGGAHDLAQPIPGQRTGVAVRVANGRPSLRTAGACRGRLDLDAIAGVVDQP